MTSHTTARTALRGLALVAVIAAASACGGSDDAAPADEPAAQDEPAAEPADEPADEPSDEPADEPADEPNAPAIGSGNATLTFETGESMVFTIRCVLEPQMAAGSEILFTAASSQPPYLDITQFGSEGAVTDIASISVYDEEYETIWDASSIYEVFGGSLELSLDGSTITGSGAFYPGDPLEVEPVNGSLTANC